MNSENMQSVTSKYRQQYTDEEVIQKYFCWCRRYDKRFITPSQIIRNEVYQVITLLDNDGNLLFGFVPEVMLPEYCR